MDWMLATTLGGLLAVLATLPLAWKWCLGLRRVALGALGLAILAGLVVTALGSRVPLGGWQRGGLAFGLTLALALVALGYRFYRDPERASPVRDDLVVSPADGEVVYVRHSRDGRLPVSTKRGRSYELAELTRTELRSAQAVVIGIGMSFLDVHVNRAPIAGVITLQRHFPGRFGSLRRPEAAFENERATTVIERGDLQVAVVQIASRLVRQIVSFTQEGQEVRLGQRIGVIRLGSQVDLVLPARDDLEVLVRPGDRLVAGVSPVAALRMVEPVAERVNGRHVGAGV